MLMEPMSTLPTPNQDACRKALQLIADPLVIEIFILLHDVHEQRFNDIKRACATNAVTLTKRLKELEHAGLLARKEYVTDRQSVTYSLTELGMICNPIVRAIADVSKRLSSNS